MSTATPVSATTPYITPTDLCNWRDWRQMGDWLSINEARPANQAAFEALSVAQEHCNAAGGLLEAACIKGHRYEVADLQALLAQGGQSASLLKRVVAFTAIDSMSRFKKRTPADDDDCKWAADMLQALADGERIFAFQETQDAGNTDDTKLLDHCHRPSVQAEPLFGVRGNRGSGPGWRW